MLFGLQVAQGAESVVQRHRRHPEHGHKRIRATRRDDVALAQHLQLVVGEVDVPPHGRHQLRAECCHELGKRDALHVLTSDPVEALEEVVLRRKVRTGEVELRTIEVGAFHHLGEGRRGVLPPQGLERLIPRADLRYNRAWSADEPQEHRDLLVARAVDVAGATDGPVALEAARQLLPLTLGAVIRRIAMVGTK